MDTTATRAIASPGKTGGPTARRATRGRHVLTARRVMIAGHRRMAHHATNQPGSRRRIAAAPADRALNGARAISVAAAIARAVIGVRLTGHAAIDRVRIGLAAIGRGLTARATIGPTVIAHGMTAREASAPVRIGRVRIGRVRIGRGVMARVVIDRMVIARAAIGRLLTGLGAIARKPSAHGGQSPIAAGVPGAGVQTLVRATSSAAGNRAVNGRGQSPTALSGP